MQQTAEDTAKVTQELEQWVFSNRLFLPGKFYEHWLTMRTNIPILGRWERNQPADKVEEISKKVDDAVSAAIDEVYKDMRIARGDWERIKR